MDDHVVPPIPGSVPSSAASDRPQDPTSDANADGTLATPMLVVNGQRYLLANLYNVHGVIWQMCRIRLASVIGAVALPLVTLLAAPYGSSVVLWESVAAATCLLLLVAVVTLKTHPRVHGIWAAVHPSGPTFELFASSDKALCEKWTRLIADAAAAARDPARSVSEPQSSGASAQDIGPALLILSDVSDPGTAPRRRPY